MYCIVLDCDNTPSLINGIDGSMNITSIDIEQIGNLFLRHTNRCSGNTHHTVIDCYDSSFHTVTLLLVLLLFSINLSIPFEILSSVILAYPWVMIMLECPIILAMLSIAMLFGDKEDSEPMSGLMVGQIICSAQDYTYLFFSCQMESLFGNGNTGLCISVVLYKSRICSAIGCRYDCFHSRFLTVDTYKASAFRCRFNMTGMKLLDVRIGKSCQT